MSQTNEMVEVEMLVKVDGSGQWEIGVDADDLKNRWDDKIGESEADEPMRVVKVKIMVPKPKAVELVATIAEEPTTGELRVA